MCLCENDPSAFEVEVLSFIFFILLRVGHGCRLRIDLISFELYVRQRQKVFFFLKSLSRNNRAAVIENKTLSDQSDLRIP